MSDFKILEKDGNVELEGVHQAIADRSLDISKLWSTVGQGDTAQAAIILFEAGFEMGEDVQIEDVRNVIIVSTPNDIHGQFYRIWVKLRQG